MDATDAWSNSVTFPCLWPTRHGGLTAQADKVADDTPR